MFLNDYFYLALSGMLTAMRVFDDVLLVTDARRKAYLLIECQVFWTT